MRATKILKKSGIETVQERVRLYKSGEKSFAGNLFLKDGKVSYKWDKKRRPAWVKEIIEDEKFVKFITDRADFEFQSLDFWGSAESLADWLKSYSLEVRI